MAAQQARQQATTPTASSSEFGAALRVSRYHMGARIGCLGSFLQDNGRGAQEGSLRACAGPEEYC